MTRSVLDDLGEEITGIVAPVSICMALVVVLVKALNPDGMADSSSVAIATIAYHEKVLLTLVVGDSNTDTTTATAPMSRTVFRYSSCLGLIWHITLRVACRQQSWAACIAVLLART